VHRKTFPNPRETSANNVHPDQFSKKPDAEIVFHCGRAKTEIGSSAMQLQNISKFLLDQPPRQVWRFLSKRLLRHKPIEMFDDEHPCVFVLSTGRAGTETLAAVITLARNVVSLHEPAPRLYELSKLAYEYSTEPFARKVLGVSFLSHRNELLNTSLAFGLGYVETSPQVTFLAPAILEVLPQARFIHIVRDPRDVVRSGMRRRWFDGHPGDTTRIMPRPDSEDGQHWHEYNPFKKNLWLWAETNRWILKFTSALSEDRIITLRSEDVFSGDENTFHTLFEFTGSPPPPARQITRLLARKLNAQRSGYFPESTSWSDDQKKDLLVTAGDIAKTLGYDLAKDDV
jgi:hypothetical protein